MFHHAISQIFLIGPIFPPVGNSMSEETQPKKNPRQLVLLALLGLLIIALVYDYKVARPGVQEGYDKVVKLSESMNRIGFASSEEEEEEEEANDESDPDADPEADEDSEDDVNYDKRELVTPERVAEELGKKPASSFEDGEEHVEVYTWRSGLVVKTHKLFVSYRKSGDGLIFDRATPWIYESSSKIKGPATVIDADPEDYEESEDYESMTGSAVPSDQGGGGGNRPGGGNQRPPADDDSESTDDDSESTTTQDDDPESTATDDDAADASTSESESTENEASSTEAESTTQEEQPKPSEDSSDGEFSIDPFEDPVDDASE